MRCAGWRLVLALALSVGACSRPAPRGEDPVPAVMAAGGRAFASPSSAEGRRLFAAYCATCHGDEGRGDGQNASRLVPRPPDLAQSVARRSPSEVRRIVEQGTASVGRSPLCPPHGRTLGEERLDMLLRHVATLGRKAEAQD